MKISLITVTYNSEKYLSHCIESVQRQSYKDIEHIIIDAKSTDGTISIIKKYEAKIAKWVSEPDRGMYDAINKGMSMATGDVVGILNSDDMLVSDDVIASIVKVFEREKVDSVYGDLEYVDKENTDRIFRIWKGKKYHRNLFRTGQRAEVQQKRARVVMVCTSIEPVLLPTPMPIPEERTQHDRIFESLGPVNRDDLHQVAVALQAQLRRIIGQLPGEAQLQPAEQHFGSRVARARRLQQLAEMQQIGQPPLAELQRQQSLRNLLFA